MTPSRRAVAVLLSLFALLCLAAAHWLDLKQGEELLIVSNDDFKLKAVKDVLEGRLVKRSVPLKALSYGKIEQAQVEQVVEPAQFVGEVLPARSVGGADRGLARRSLSDHDLSSPRTADRIA